jgi:hypothetical protein
VYTPLGWVSCPLEWSHCLACQNCSPSFKIYF